MKDVNRTFPQSNYFYSNSSKTLQRGQLAIFEVLKMFTKFDKGKCGYVQGMNFIAGALTYHASPEFSFCMFIKLMQKFQILENYVEGLKGLKQR